MSYKNYRNPSELPCWRSCTSCYRCSEKGKWSKCRSCSGRHDPDLKRDPYYIDDQCRCTEGVLVYRTKQGQWAVAQFNHDPFGGSATIEPETQDEREWKQYVEEKRDRLGDPTFDPVRFNDGTSTLDWTEEQKG